MHRIVGIDIGANALRAAVLQSSFRGFEFLGFHEAAIDPQAPREDGLRAALKELAKDRRLAADVVAVALPGARVATHLFTLPFVDDKRLAQTLPFEVEGAIPFDIADVVWDYQPIAQQDGKTDVLVAVAKKDDVGGLLKLLAEVGLDPRVVVPPALSYHALFEQALVRGASRDHDTNGCDALVDIGSDRTSITIVSGARLEFARISPGGVKHSLDLAIALAPAVREIRNALAAHHARSHRRALRLHLAGPLADRTDVADHLTRELGLPTTPLALDTDKLRLPPGTDVAVQAQALALAIRAQSTRSARLTLRRGPFAFTRESQELRGGITRLAAYAALLLVLFAGMSLARLRTLKNQETALDTALCDTTQRILGACEKDYRVALAKLRGHGSPTSTLPHASALDLFAEISSHLPEDVPVNLQEADVSTSTVRLKGETESFEQVDKVEAAVKRYKCFGTVSRGRVQKNPAGKIEFNLEVKYTCGATEKASG